MNVTSVPKYGVLLTPKIWSKKVPYAKMRFFFCTHVQLYDLPTRRPTLWVRPPRWQLQFSPTSPTKYCFCPRVFWSSSLRRGTRKECIVCPKNEEPEFVDWRPPFWCHVVFFRKYVDFCLLAFSHT